MNWKKLLLNIGLSAGSAFIGGWQVTGSAKLGAGAAVATAIGNAVGLVQQPPQDKKKQGIILAD